MNPGNDASPLVGLIGLGNMGTPFAERILAAGYHLLVYSRTPEKARACVDLGATAATSPEDLAQRVDVLLTSLPDDRALEEVMRQVVESARPGTILVDLSTVSPTASANVASLAEAAAVGYLRAPVSGNPTVVRAGTLSVIVSGPREVFEQAEDVIRALGPTIFYVGDGEQARVVKLALNLMIAGLAQLMAEALVLGEAAGVERAALLEAMGASAVAAPFVKYKTEPLLRDDYSATFTTALMEKDLDLILDLAAETDIKLPFALAVKSLLRKTIDGGYADQDFMALYLQLRKASGLDVTAESASRVGV